MTRGEPTPRSIQGTYLGLMFGNTLAASLIWGINTIFLLDAGLSNLEAFTANAFFTAGMVVFEVPTGIVADTAGRRLSYLLGTVTLAGSTLLYVGLWEIEGPFWAWAAASMLLGLGFTFFSGAVEAWLVDALTATGFTGTVESVFARGQIVSGVAMLGGSVAGGFIAEQTSLAVPFVLRGVILAAMFGVAFALMHDLGFTPEKGGGIPSEVRKVASASVEYGWRVPAVKWLMLESLAMGGVGIYAFYAMQPYLLELWGDPQAYQIAGLVAAIVAGAQICGGIAAPWIRRQFTRRTSALILIAVLNVVTLGLIGLADSFWPVLGLIVVWGLLFAAAMPIRQTYLNGMIPSRQRATILSFDSLMGSSGGVWTQPLLGRAADVWGYAPSYVMGAGISALAVPFLALSRRENAPADTLDLTELRAVREERPLHEQVQVPVCGDERATGAAVAP
ncbi:MAG TPA: MFS transporter [Gaiellaceae bacterium]|nr:MFS transporter [Gaiellaceae bacterium]